MRTASGWIALFVLSAIAFSAAPRGRAEEPKSTPRANRPDELHEQRRATLMAMQAVMGALPGPEKRCLLDMQIGEETDCGNYVRRTITYASEPGSRVPAFLLIPKALLDGSGARAPAVLCLHPTDNLHGNRVVVGLGGQADAGYASELAGRGFVTLAPAYPLLADYQPDIEALGYVSGTMKAVWDNIRGLDLLASLPFVQPDGFGAIGHSLGGHNAIFTAAFDPRIRAAVSSCGLDSFRDYKGGDITGWTSRRYMPRLAAFRGRPDELPFDFDLVLAAIAPRAVFLSAPLKDSNFSAPSVDRVAAEAGKTFALLESGGSLVVQHPDCGHAFPERTREAAYAWLAQQLKRPR